MVELVDLRHDHHGCRLCKRQRAEAADEIVRLQETLVRERDVSRVLGEDIAAMEAEIRRLRAAETDEVAP